MSSKSFVAKEVAIDVIEVLAKHELSINAVETVFYEVVKLLQSQTIVKFNGY